MRKVLDGEMRDATRSGVDIQTRKEPQEEITTEEEDIFWQKGLLGENSAECLLHTVYFYNDKLFGLRANEHRLLRVANIVLKDNQIIFDESISKTFHGGLKHLKRSSRLINHVCHEKGVTHGIVVCKVCIIYI